MAGDFRACLVSLPWCYHQSPSLAIGTLAAHAQHKGHAVEALHLHLEAAALMGLGQYDLIAHRLPLAGEAIFASRLLPDERDRLTQYLARYFQDPEEGCADMEQALRLVYESHDWSPYALVGFTVHFAQLFASLLFAGWLKQDHPRIRVVLGGGCITAKLGGVILDRFAQVDWCVHGEGEASLVGLVQGLSAGAAGFESGVHGLIHRQPGGARANPAGEPPSMGGMPDPDYDHYFRIQEDHPALERQIINSYLPIEVSRGCPNACAFCNFSQGRPHRVRPALEVSACLDRLARRHGVYSISLMALMIPPKSCLPLFNAIAAHGRDYRIFCEARAGLDKEQLAAMKRAGVTEVQIGMEAMDTRLLGKMRKGTRFIDNLQIMKYCQELGMRTGDSFLMLGFPSETQDDVDRSVLAIDFAAAYEPPGQIVTFSLREGSPVDLHPEQYGITRVEDPPLFRDLLAAPGGASAGPLDGVTFWYKDFHDSAPPRDYGALRRRMEAWQRSNEAARREGRALLHYLDYQDYLVIEDFRGLGGQGQPPSGEYGRTSTVLDGWQRRLYLFCDAIRTASQIADHAAPVPWAQVQACLDRLVELRLMFQEQGHYLSLAVRGDHSARRNLPFPWF